MGFLGQYCSIMGVHTIKTYKTKFWSFSKHFSNSKLRLHLEFLVTFFTKNGKNFKFRYGTALNSWNQVMKYTQFSIWSMKILSPNSFSIFENNCVIKILLRPCCGIKFQFRNFLLYTHEKLVILSIQWHIASQKIPTLTIVKLRLKSAKNYDEGFKYLFMVK